MNTGKSLRICLVKHDMSQTKLAQELNVSRASINRFCRTESMSMNSIQRFAEYFGISVNEFIALGEE